MAGSLLHQLPSVVGVITEVAVILLGLVFSGAFSSSEVAFFSPSTTTGTESGSDDEDDLPKRRITKMLKTPRRLLATILICNTFANIITSVVAAVLTGQIAGHYGFSEVIVYGIEVIVLTFAIVVMSEITPKIIAIKNPLYLSRMLSGFIYVFYILLKPIAILMARTTSGLEDKLPKPQSRLSTSDMKAIAEVGELEGSLEEEEREILENVIDFGNTMVKEIMTSRVNMVAISAQDHLETVMEMIREKSLSRMPLYNKSLDNILGVVHAKDLLPYVNADVRNTPINWRTLARKTIFVPVSKKLDDLLEDFQREKTHMAIVVDEYGGTEGLVTMDDLLEEIIGDISDEYDEEEKLFRRIREGVYIFDAKIDLDDMEEVLDCELTTDDDEYETLGGLVYHLTERIPNVGEKVTFRELELMVHSVENNRVRKLRVTLPAKK